MMKGSLKSLRSLANNATVASRCLASQATASKSKSAPSQVDVKVSTLPSGAILASVPSETPLARLAVVVRAGARYEPADQLGLTHILRSATGLSTEGYTSFGINRNIEYFGGRLSVTGTRDTMSYLLEMHNDDDILVRQFGMLADTLSRPSFKAWELPENKERIEAELAIVEDTPFIKLAEALHSVAFKGGLRKSLYTPRHMLGQHTPEMLRKYVQTRFVAPVIVGVGIDHSQLVDLVGTGLTLGTSKPPACVCKFIGGETHIDSNSPLTYVALAGEGAGLKSPKEAWSFALLQSILGSGSQIKNTTGLSSVGRLSKAVKASLGDASATGIAVSSFNFCYEDLGLFGINIIAPSSSNVTSVVKAAVKELRAAATSITDAELTAAKNNAKTSALLASESGDSLALDLGQQLALTGSQVDAAHEIDSVSLADIKAVAGKLLKSKLAVATIGRNAPYLDDILEK